MPVKNFKQTSFEQNVLAGATAGAASGLNTATTIKQDETGQSVVNTGAGTAKKSDINIKDTNLYLTDANGRKVLASSGKNKYEQITLPSLKENQTTLPSGGVVTDATKETNTSTNISEETNTSTNISEETNTSTNISEETNTVTQSNTGSGIESALGYSWDEKAKEYANKQYAQSKAETESEYSTKASELKTEAQTQQEDLEMQKYSNAQTADKLGWTGGYILDQQRQMEVLKAGIQAQLYNTQELNRLGLESSLAAARLNADLQNTELAYQYYQDAIQNALNEAATTGFYISAEAQDMLTQQRAAQQILATSDANSTDAQQAQKIVDYVDKWFTDNGISKAGTKVLSYLQYELSQEEANLEAKQLEISYIMASKESDDYKEGKAGLYYDENGKMAFAGTTEDDPFGSGPDLVDFASLTSDKLVEICNKNANNSTFFEQCISYKLDEVYKLYQNFLTEQELDASVNSWETFASNYGKTAVDNYSSLLEKISEINSFDFKEILNNIGIAYGELFIGADFTIKDDTTSINAANKNTGQTTDSNNTNTSNSTTTTKTTDIILNKNYSTGEEATKDLLKSDTFQSLLDELNTLDLTSAPADWFHDPENTWGKALTWIPWIDNIGTGEYSDILSNLQKTKKKIIDSIGESNCKLISEYCNEYTNMSDREKGLLSETDRNLYEQIETFNTKMSQIDIMINYYEKHDANLFVNPWESIGETWTNYGNNWANTDNILDVVTNVLDTAGAVVETVVDAVYGALQWITGGWFGATKKKK